MKLNLHVLAVLLLAVTVSACGGNKRPVYQGAEYYKNLEVPPDLTEPDTGEQLRVPRPTEEALQRFRDNNKLETFVSPKFDKARVVNYAGDSWIEIDNTPDHVWEQLIKFWQQEGIALSQARPLLGFMETEWTTRLQPEKGWFSSLFSSSEPDQKDRFRVRLERTDTNKTRVFFHHSRIEREPDGDDGFVWVTLPGDVEAEREIIGRMALFAGLSEEQREAISESYQPYASLVEKDQRDATALSMKGDMGFVWRRALRALDRLGAQEVDPRPQQSVINFRIKKPSEKEMRLEGDEIARNSWIMKLFEDANTSSEEMLYKLHFIKQGNTVRVRVSDENDQAQEDEDGFTSDTAVVEQIRDALARAME